MAPPLTAKPIEAGQGTPAPKPMPGPAGAPTVSPEAPALSGDQYQVCDAPAPAGLAGTFVGSVVSFFEPAVQQGSLEDEIKIRKEQIQTAKGPDLAEALSRMGELEKAKEEIAALDKLTIRRVEFAKLAKIARKQILAGVMDPCRKADYEKGVKTLRALQKYETLEKKRAAVLRAAESAYPKDSRFFLQLDFSGLDPKSFGLYEPPLEFFQNLPVVKLHAALKASQDPNERRVAETIEKLFQLFRETKSVNETQKLFGPAASLEELEAASGELEGLLDQEHFNDAVVFFAKVKDKERENASQNEGYQTRTALAETLTMLQVYATLPQDFENHEKNGLKNITPEMLQGLRDVLVKRCEAHLKSFPDSPLEPRTRLEKVVREIKTYVERRMQRLKEMKIDRTSLKSSFDSLKTTTEMLFKMEEDLARCLCEKLIDQAESLPSPEINVAPIRAAFALIGPDKIPSLPARVKAYQQVVAQVDSASLIRMIDARLKMYDRQERTVGIADGIGQGLAGANPFRDAKSKMIDQALFGQAKAFAEIRAKYQVLRDLVASGDPAKIAAARADLIKLEQAGIHKHLEGIHGTASTVNEFTIGLGVLIAASTAGAVAGAYVAALFEEGLLASVVGFATNVAVFTATSELLDTLIYEPGAFAELAHNPGKTLGKISLGFGGKFALNAAMFLALGGSMKVYEKGIELIALRNVSKSLGTKITAKMLVGSAVDPSIKAAVQNEIKSLSEKGLTKLGAFAWEFNTFVHWQFVQTAGQLALNGHPHPLSAAAKMTYDPKGLMQNGAFLVALKAGSTLSRPLLKPMDERLQLFVMGKQFEREMNQLREETADLQAKLEECVKSGSKDIGEALKGYELALLKQGALLRQVPEQYRNPQTEAANEQALKEVTQFKQYMGAYIQVFATGNRYGVLPVEGQNYFVYRDYKDMRKYLSDALLALPDCAGIESVSPVNGVIVANFETPSGTIIKKIFKPAGPEDAPRTTPRMLPQLPEPAGIPELDLDVGVPVLN